MKIAQTFSAFSTIEQHFCREEKLPKEEQSLDKVGKSRELLFAIYRVLREFGIRFMMKIRCL